MTTPTVPVAGTPDASLPATPLRRLAAALHYRDFRVLWAGAFTSSIGTWMQKVAQNWLVLTITGSASAFYLGLDTFLGEAPILLFTLIGGVVADRRDRRQLLLMSQHVQMATAFTLAALVYWDVVRIWHVLTLSVITGMAQAFGGPAHQSLLPLLIDKQHLPNAIALNSIQFNLARVIGPLIAGATLAAFGIAACFGLNGLSFLAVIVALLSLRVRHIPPSTVARLRDELRGGFSIVRRQPALVGADVPRVRDNVSRESAADVSATVCAERVSRRCWPVHAPHGFAGAGAVTGALVVAWLGTFERMGRTVLTLQVVFGGLVVLFSVTRVLWINGVLLCRWRVHGDGVRDDLVARTADCAQRAARTSDEHLHGGVPRWNAAGEPGGGLYGHGHVAARSAHRERRPAWFGRGVVPDQRWRGAGSIFRPRAHAKACALQARIRSILGGRCARRTRSPWVEMSRWPPSLTRSP